MNAIGEQLKAAREARGLSLEHVCDETNIAKRYLAAMEAEDFSVFPGDPYIVGFLRNYADYLGLDSSAIVQAFRGIRIQEQPVPIQQLLEPKRAPLWPFIAGGAVLAAAAAAFIIVGALGRSAEQGEAALEKKEPVQYTMEGAQFEKRFYEGDTLLVTYQGETFRLAVAKIDDRVSIETPVGTARFMLGEEASIDLDKNNEPELVAFLVDFQKGDASKGAVIRWKPAGALAASLPAATLEDESSLHTAPAAASATAPAVPAAAAALTAAPATPDRQSTKESVVFSGKRSPHPFVINVTFRNYAMFRHEIDRHDREERYYHKGDQITVTANNAAKLWTSNAAACKLTIQASGGQSVDVELGSPGEVAVKQVKWVQGDDGLWSLCVFNVN